MLHGTVRQSGLRGRHAEDRLENPAEGALVAISQPGSDVLDRQLCRSDQVPGILFAQPVSEGFTPLTRTLQLSLMMGQEECHAAEKAL